MFHARCFIPAFLAFFTIAGAAQAERRVALVIGNANYDSVAPLKNPVNDATGVAKVLRELGFEVTLLTDLDKASFEQRVSAFANSLSGASAAVFYYAGHGMQVDGRNYLVPVDAKINDEADLPFELVSIDIVMQRLAHHRITNIVILDACRDNPLGQELSKKLGDRPSAVTHGLAPVSAGYATVVSYSTNANQTALDGDGEHSPYSSALIQHIPVENLEVIEMLRRVGRDVMKATSREQEPWINFSLIDHFFFRPGSGGPQDGFKSPERQRQDSKETSEAIVRNGKPPVQPCDVIAGSASDPERVTDGKSMGDLNGPEGVKACRAALSKYPHTPRFEFQLARSLHKAGQYDEAAALYRSLVQRGYFASLTNYGWMLHNGEGVPKNQKEAVRLYLLAAQQGDNFGMFNTAMAYDSGEGLPYNPRQAAHWIYAALRLGHGYSIDRMSQSANGWTRDFRLELQRLLRRAGAYNGPIDGNFGPEIARAVRQVQALPFPPKPGGDVPKQRFDPKSIPVNSPPPR